MNIGLIGTGAYGQAMAMMLLKNNNDVSLFGLVLFPFYFPHIYPILFLIICVPD